MKNGGGKWDLLGMQLIGSDRVFATDSQEMDGIKQAADNDMSLLVLLWLFRAPSGEADGRGKAQG